MSTLRRCPRAEARYMECRCRCYGCRWSCAAHETIGERVIEWALQRWCARRFDEERGHHYPRWWRARQARRLVGRL